MYGTETFLSLTRTKKEAIGLLSIGTFLEYFNLMLYVHMAVLLNELFFPKTDPHTVSLTSAFAFCSIYLPRPFGALIFGWIGDNIGRKTPIIITTFMMSLSCIMIANLPTYDEIGITAAYIVTACRLIQGLSSLGEVSGAQIYLTEIINPPTRYPIVALIEVMISFSGIIALVVASMTSQYNWRIAFCIGAGIAIIGIAARTALRETSDFTDARRKIQQVVKKVADDPKILKNNATWQKKMNTKTILAYCLMLCPGNIGFYITIIYCAQILQNVCGYTVIQVINQNLLIMLWAFVSELFLVWLSYKIYPLKILTVKLYCSVLIALICPCIFYYFNTPCFILLLQLCFASVWLSGFPAVAIFLQHFPVFKRSTYSSFLLALSDALMFVITSFSIIYLVKYFNYWGLWVILIPIIIGYWFGFSHFKKLTKETVNQL